MIDKESTAGATQATAAMAKLCVKLPPLWPSDPKVWFTQVEVHFTTRRITAQKIRFEYVAAALPPEAAMEISDLIRKPTPTLLSKNNSSNALLPRHNAAYSNYSTLRNWESGSQPNF